MRVTIYTCDGCDRKAESRQIMDDDGEVNLHRPASWRTVSNHTGEYDLCPSCGARYDRAVNPQMWEREAKVEPR